MKRVKLSFLIIFTFFNFTSVLFAGVINDGWKDSRAYRPEPVLFLHGFGSGNPGDWENVDSNLSQYFSKYYTNYSADPTVLASTRYPYLEIIDFGSSNIDRNSSVDTYKIGDRYVLAGKRFPGDPGWADKLNVAIQLLNQYYVTNGGSLQKVILVGYSMGGLAARKYLKSLSYANQKISKLILIGTPNLGSDSATLANILHRNRRWGVYLNGIGWVSSDMIAMLDVLLELRFRIDIDGDAVWDMDAQPSGSGFIRELNSNYSSLIEHFAIIGRHWLDFNLGDSTVSLESQLGTGVLSLKNYAVVPALHWFEVGFSVSGDNPLLKFLDSRPPEFEISSPNPSGTTEIYESSIHIKGKVYKEYLPADTKLIINVTRQDNNYTLPVQMSLLKPSDLWIPNNPDSPVAEFDEVINFPGGGTYKISCQVKNPAGLTSDIKDVWVKVVVPIEIVSWEPTGISLSLKPFIYAKIVSNEFDVDITKTSMSLDAIPVNFSYNLNGNLELEIYYVPLSDLSLTTHTVLVVSQDIKGNIATKTWTFTTCTEIPVSPEPYPPPIGYHWVWKGIGSYQDLGADSFVGYYTRHQIPPEEWQGWTEEDFIAEAELCRRKARANGHYEHAGPNNYQRVNEYTAVHNNWAFGRQEESSFCDWTAKHFAVQNLETPNPPDTIAVIPVYTVSSLSYGTDWFNGQTIVPIINTNHMGTFVAKDHASYWGGNERRFVIPYTPTLDLVTTADVNFPIVITYYGGGPGNLTVRTKQQYYTWTNRYTDYKTGAVGWVLTKD